MVIITLLPQLLVTHVDQTDLHVVRIRVPGVREHPLTRCQLLITITTQTTSERIRVEKVYRGDHVISESIDLNKTIKKSLRVKVVRW